MQQADLNIGGCCKKIEKIKQCGKTNDEPRQQTIKDNEKKSI